MSCFAPTFVLTSVQASQPKHLVIICVEGLKQIGNLVDRYRSIAIHLSLLTFLVRRNKVAAEEPVVAAVVVWAEVTTRAATGAPITILVTLEPTRMRHHLHRLESPLERKKPSSLCKKRKTYETNLGLC
jgi:hypothetical protein